MPIGENIKDLCKEKGITLKELSEKSGVPVNTIYTLTREDPINARGKTLKPLAEALGVSVEILQMRSGVKDWAEEINSNFYGALKRYYYKYENLATGVNIIDILDNKYFIPYENIDNLEERLIMGAYNLLARELEKYKK